MEEQGCDPFSCDGFLCGAENYPLSQPMVSHNQERIERQKRRKVHDKVTGGLLEGASTRGLDWGEGGYSGVSICLVLLTGGAAFDIFLDIGGQARPPELSSNKLASLKEARMSSSFMVIMAE